MGNNELKEQDLEQELEALYKKVASVDSFGDSTKQEIESREPTDADEELELPKQPEEALPQDKDVRKSRLFHIISVLGLLTLSFIIVAVLVWPKIYHYNYTTSGGKTYVLRVNSLTGKSMYFNGKEWQHPPIPANPVKRSSERPKDQPPPENIKNWKYAIQIKAYPEFRNSDAVAFVEYLKKGRPDVHMEKVHLPGRGIWYRIFIGYFMTADEASDYIKKEKIVDAYPGSYVQSISK